MLARTLGGALVFASLSCGPRPARAPAETHATAWLCRPDRDEDPCRTADLTTTELHADGSRSVVRGDDAEARPAADCFYVYPTVDLELVPGNHTDLTATARPLAATTAQVGAFRGTCALWVPLYRQVTLGTYLQPRDVLEAGLRVAEADVDRAFREYLRIAEPGRRIVLVGHSQGGEMVIRLLRRHFDPSPAMRARLVLAMAIGAEVEVSAGRTRGATLANIPLCTRPEETGCVVAYRTHGSARPSADRFAPGPGNETACVNPASLDDARPRLRRSLFPVRDSWSTPWAASLDVSTPFLAVDDFYEARCREGDAGYRYLEVVPGSTPDARGKGPVDLGHPRFTKGPLGLHVLDLQLPNGDLLALLRRRLGPHSTQSFVSDRDANMSSVDESR